MKKLLLALLILSLPLFSYAQEQWSVNKAYEYFRIENYYAIFEERTADFIKRKCLQKVDSMDIVKEKSIREAERSKQLMNNLPTTYNIETDDKFRDLMFEVSLALDAQKNLPGPSVESLSDLWNDSICDYDVSQGVTSYFENNAITFCKYIDGQIFACNVIAKAFKNANQYLSTITRTKKKPITKRRK